MFPHWQLLAEDPVTSVVRKGVVLATFILFLIFCFLDFNGFSLVWLLSCSRRCQASINCLSHVSHLKQPSFVCFALMCFFIFQVGSEMYFLHPLQGSDPFNISRRVMVLIHFRVCLFMCFFIPETLNILPHSRQGLTFSSFFWVDWP